MCTNMTEDEFKNVHYVFCNKKCENKLSIPANFTSITLTRKRKSVTAKHKSNNVGKDNALAKKNNLKAFPNKSVLHHYCDISCSYEEPSLINNTHLSIDDTELSIFHNNIRSLNKNFHKIEEEIFINCTKLPEIIALSETKLNNDSTIPFLEGYVFENTNSLLCFFFIMIMSIKFCKL